MDYGFLALQFLPLNESKGFLIKFFNGVMEGQILVILRHMEGQETSDSDPHQRTLQNYLAFCTHPDVRRFKGNIYVYMQERD